MFLFKGTRSCFQTADFCRSRSETFGNEADETSPRVHVFTRTFLWCDQRQEVSVKPPERRPGQFSFFTVNGKRDQHPADCDKVSRVEASGPGWRLWSARAQSCVTSPEVMKCVNKVYQSLSGKFFLCRQRGQRTPWSCDRTRSAVLTERRFEWAESKVKKEDVKNMWCIKRSSTVYSQLVPLATELCYCLSGGQRSNHCARQGDQSPVRVIDSWLVILSLSKLHTSIKLMSSLHVRRFAFAAFRCPHLPCDSTNEPIRLGRRRRRGRTGWGAGLTLTLKGALWTHYCWLCTCHMMVCSRTKGHLRSEGVPLRGRFTVGKLNPEENINDRLLVIIISVYDETKQPHSDVRRSLNVPQSHKMTWGVETISSDVKTIVGLKGQNLTTAPDWPIKWMRSWWHHPSGV